MCEQIVEAALEEAADYQECTAYPGSVHEEDAVEFGPIDDPSTDSVQPVHGTELIEAEEKEQEELYQFILPDMTDPEQQRTKEWRRLPRSARRALRRYNSKKKLMVMENGLCIVDREQLWDRGLRQHPTRLRC